MGATRLGAASQQSAVMERARLLSLPELEERSGGISRHTWRLWCRQGRLVSVRLGRRLMVEESAYVDYIARCRTAARSA